MSATSTSSREAMIDNAPIRKAFERSGLAPSTVALRIGWTASVKRPRFEKRGDTTRLKRMLGMQDMIRKDGSTYRQQVISEGVAVMILEAMNVDPVDVGL